MKHIINKIHCNLTIIKKEMMTRIVLFLTLFCLTTRGLTGESSITSLVTTSERPISVREEEIKELPLLRGRPVPSNIEKYDTTHRIMQDSNAILSVEIIRIMDDVIIGNLVNGVTINLKNYPLVTKPANINFKFVTGFGTQSVYVQYESLGTPNSTMPRVDNLVPFSLCGDLAGDFYGCKDMKMGLNRIIATPYSLRGLKGMAGSQVLIEFTIINEVKPQLIGSWESYPAYPIPVGEGQGAFLSNGIFFLYSGFTNWFDQVTKDAYTYDTKNISAIWQKTDDIILPVGVSHCSYAVKGSVLYSCGGYVGSHPGPATNKCLKYDHDKPTGEKWEYLPDLPAPRAGGGMVLDSVSNTLLYATGASRPNPSNPLYTIDHYDTWELNLNNLSAGWMIKPKIPYLANHIGSVTVKYQGTERHYFLGGQRGENERRTNQNLMFEWNRVNNLWVQRQNLTIGRGHFSSSVVPYKENGFLIFGGRYNTGQTSNVTYYEIATDSWMTIGDIPQRLNTPVCGMENSMAYCQTGNVSGTFSYKIAIT